MLGLMDCLLFLRSLSSSFFVDGVDEMPEQFCEIYKEILISKSSYKKINIKSCTVQLFSFICFVL